MIMEDPKPATPVAAAASSTLRDELATLAEKAGGLNLSKKDLQAEVVATPRRSVSKRPKAPPRFQIFFID